QRRRAAAAVAGYRITAMCTYPLRSSARRQPRYPLFPYTTLFRSRVSAEADDRSRAPCRGLRRDGAHRRPPSDGAAARRAGDARRSEEHTSELQSLRHLVCRLLLEKKKSQDAVLTAHLSESAELLV